MASGCNTKGVIMEEEWPMLNKIAAVVIATIIGGMLVMSIIQYVMVG